jgi:hypothetical protein
MRLRPIVIPTRQGFERFAQKRGMTVAFARTTAIASTVVATLGFFGLCAMLAVLVEIPLLKVVGEKVVATADLSANYWKVDPNGHKRSWHKIAYTFPTVDGREMHGVIDRPALELALIPPQRFEVLYLPQWPTLNVPEAIQRPQLLLVFLVCMLSALSIYYMLLAVQAFAYLKVMTTRVAS